jgi:hypothetical protein
VRQQSFDRALHRIDPSVPPPARVIPDSLIALGPFFDWLNHKLLGAPRTFQSDMVSAAKGKLWNVSNERAKRILGWRQQVPFEQSLADTMATLRGLRGGVKAPQPQAMKVEA